MSQSNVIMERIANIQITVQVPGLPIPYVLQAEPYQPSNMSSVSCPFWVNEVRGGPSDLPIANGQQYVTDTVIMNLCVARKEANIDLKYGVAETLQWRDAVYAMFAKHIKLSAPVVGLVSSTNTNPITIVTATPHCLVSGDQVTVDGHLVNTNANGIWIATVTDPNTFTIPVAGNGAGGATGTARKTAYNDLNAILTDSVIFSWDLVPYMYGDVEFLDLQFMLRVREMYVQPLDI
jgi:hypothetical protein